MTTKYTILGIESSCDDTAAAVLCGTASGAEILSNEVHGQTDLHAPFGGVVPEIAARAHAEKLDFVVEDALRQAEVSLDNIDAIAVTSGPGLIGGVVSGVMLAKGLSAATDKPLIGVNHLAGHALTPRLTDQVPFPYLMLLVSGGHCQFLIVHSADRFERLGGTIDDAPGEAFDKTARLLGLAQPGGPSVEACARQGDATRVALPRPLVDRPDCNMSFSGLKTATLRARDSFLIDGRLRSQDQADLAASFQTAVADILSKKTKRALEKYREVCPSGGTLAVAGGVAANQAIRAKLSKACENAGVTFIAPPLPLCTDNAAMIAYAGLCRYEAGDFDDFSFSARPRWPLDDQRPSMLGSGKKGAKA